MERELKFKSELLDQYKSSDTSLANVHKQREQRLEHRQSFLLLDLEKGQDALKELYTEKEALDRELQEKETVIEEQSKKIESLKLVIAEQNNIKNQTVENRTQKLGQDVLKLKLEIDQRNKECQKLQSEKTQLINEKNKLDEMLKEQICCANDIQDTLQSQGKELVSKCEQLYMLQYQLDLEKKKMADFQKDLQMKENNGLVVGTPRRGSCDHDYTDMSRLRGESYRSQIQFLECRIKLLEERIAMYRNQVRDVSREITEITEDVTKSSNIKDRIFVHGTTVVEKVQRELHENIVMRKTKLENSLDDVLRMAPIAITKEACEIRADTLTLKKQAEVHRVNDVFVRCSRLLTRVDACEKTKFSGKFINGSGPVIQNGSTNTNIRPNSGIPVRPKKDEFPERCFTVVAKKPPTNGPLLSRPRQANGSALPLWKRKHSLSMDIANCISPALIDLSLSPSTSPSPREKKSFFPQSQSMPGFDFK